MIYRCTRLASAEILLTGRRVVVDTTILPLDLDESPAPTKTLWGTPEEHST